MLDAAAKTQILRCCKVYELYLWAFDEAVRPAKSVRSAMTAVASTSTRAAVGVGAAT